MKLTRSAALLVGVLTLAPLVYIVYFTTYLIPKLMSATAAGGIAPDEFNRTFQAVFRIHLVAILLVFLLVAFYIVYLFRTDRVQGEKKALWAVVLFLGNLLAMPVHFQRTEAY